MRIPGLKALRRSAAKLGDRALHLYEDAVTPYWTAMARRRRADYCRSYVALSGSCGKTTTTMLVSRLVGAQRSVATSFYANTARWTLRSMRKLDHVVDCFLQEVSEYPAGTLAAIGRAMKPDAVVITAIGLDHQTAFRTREAVAAEMATLVACVGPEGIVCLNADDNLARGLAASVAGRVVLYGRSADAEVRAEAVAPQLPERLSFHLVVGGRRRHVRTRFVGTLMLDNILAALALVHALGLDLDRAIADLAAIEPLENRMSVFEGKDGHLYLRDARKAPFWTVQKLIADFDNLYAGRRIIVLGNISDIGSNESQKYRQVLRRAAAAADLVIGIGRSSQQVSRLRDLEPERTNLRAARDMDEVRDLLAAEPPALVVLKGNKLNCSSLLAAVHPAPPPPAPYV